MPEVGDVLRIANRCGIIIADNSCLADALSQSWGNVEEVNARIAACSADELTTMSVVDKIDVWRARENIIVDKETGGCIGQLVRGIVNARHSVEITHHSP